jgi:hypothetical protein
MEGESAKPPGQRCNWSSRGQNEGGRAGMERLAGQRYGHRLGADSVRGRVAKKPRRSSGRVDHHCPAGVLVGLVGVVGRVARLDICAVHALPRGAQLSRPLRRRRLEDRVEQHRYRPGLACLRGRRYGLSQVLSERQPDPADPGSAGPAPGGAAQVRTVHALAWGDQVPRPRQLRRLRAPRPSPGCRPEQPDLSGGRKGVPEPAGRPRSTWA